MKQFYMEVETWKEHMKKKWGIEPEVTVYFEDKAKATKTVRRLRLERIISEAECLLRQEFGYKYKRSFLEILLADLIKYDYGGLVDTQKKAITELISAEIDRCECNAE